MGVPRVPTNEELAASHARWLRIWEAKYAHRWRVIDGKYYPRPAPTPAETPPLSSQELLRRQQRKQLEEERLRLVGHNQD